MALLKGADSTLVCCVCSIYQPLPFTSASPLYCKLTCVYSNMKYGAGNEILNMLSFIICVIRYQCALQGTFHSSQRGAPVEAKVGVSYTR